MTRTPGGFAPPGSPPSRQRCSDIERLADRHELIAAVRPRARSLRSRARGKGLVDCACRTHLTAMSDPLHRFAIDAAADGKFYLLDKRSHAADGKGIAAFRWPGPNAPQPFETAADAMRFARDNLGATDADFAELPGLP